jgi:hypothetical protein
MMPKDNKPKHYWYHIDRCFNVTMSDNPPASWIPYIECENKILPSGDIKKILTRGDVKSTITVVKKDINSMDTVRRMHNVVHRMLADGVKESKNYVDNEKDKYCSRKQSEKLNEKLKKIKKVGA